MVQFPLLADGRGGVKRDRRAETSSVRPERSSGLAVLIVEDNLDGRESLRALLELWGHRVEVAETGPEGLRQALAAAIDVALVDIGLPEMDGNELARRVRAASTSSRLPLIAMTGYGQPEDRMRAFEAGFDQFLVKPVDPDELYRLLVEVSRQRRSTS